jgi:predicted ArsR family transcriptional regulator
MLRQRTSATVAELADALEVHPNTIRFHLGSLEEAGDVVREKAKSRAPGRPELRYRLTPSDGEADRRADLLARILLARVAEAEDPEAEAEAAGRHWGSSAAADAGEAAGVGESAGGGKAATESGSGGVEGLIETLESTGFAPVRTEPNAIELFNCPLREFLGAHGRLVCEVHRGLMAGYLDASRSTYSMESLEPFATEASCRARLHTRAEAAQS